MIEVKNLIFEYPTKRALHDVSCVIKTGSITALVGPNGAGKTTLIRCIVGLHGPFSGQVLFDGVDVHEHPRDCHRRMAYLSDFFGVYDQLTVRQCLTYTARAYGVSGDQVRTVVEAAAERLKLTDRLREKAGALSRGLRQRLAIAQAIVHEPEFLVLDEPASGLDPEARQSLSMLLIGLRDAGMTLLVSSHILAELEGYCTDMLIMREGRIIDSRQLAGDLTDARRLRIDLATPSEKLSALLEETPGVAQVSVTDEAATLLFSGDMAAQHGLLRRLVDAGVPVAGLREDRIALQDAYIAQIHKYDAGKTSS
ncbi:MAG: ABC-2 type transport system ATP-binding protein [Paracoccaceae bacterium]|jgi:ABC-2 type transport system ATP-binding protein